jgi:hypothetical protein
MRSTAVERKAWLNLVISWLWSNEFGIGSCPWKPSSACYSILA